ncbi:hypothetical protein BS50DRAFT_455838, partial [Corynespora cassiicola Philippines]
ILAMKAFCLVSIIGLASGAAMVPQEPKSDGTLSMKHGGKVGTHQSGNKMTVVDRKYIELPTPTDLKVTQVSESPAKLSNDTNTRAFDFECILPLDAAADVEDCDAICEWFAEHSGFIHLPPLQERYIISGSCDFSVANLKPCQAYKLPMSYMAPICRNILGQCVADGYDGIIRESGRVNLAYALYGIQSLP